MMKSLALAAAVSLALILPALNAPALASAFWPGHAAGVPAHDRLYARAWPDAGSRIIGSYRNGENISLTGRCKNTVTNVSFRIDAGGSAAWKYSRMRRANVWCQVMTPAARLGWVRGRHVWPE